MKKCLSLLMAFGLMFGACQRNPSDSLLGTWTVSKVNVQFDEQHSTPDLVKQVGEMEKQNVISISKDSTLVFKGLEEEWQGRASLKNDTLYLEGTAFGVWKGGEIVTRTGSPLGEIIVTYRKG